MAKKALKNYMKQMLENFENVSIYGLVSVDENYEKATKYQQEITGLYSEKNIKDRSKKIHDLTMKSMKEFIGENYKKLKENIEKGIYTKDGKFGAKDGTVHTPTEFFYAMRDMCAQIYGPNLNMKDPAVRKQVMEVLRAPYNEMQKEYANKTAVDTYITDLKREGKYSPETLLQNAINSYEKFDAEAFVTDLRESEGSINDTTDESDGYDDGLTREERYAARKEDLTSLCIQFRALEKFHNSRNAASRAVHRSEIDALNKIREKLESIRKNDPNYKDVKNFDDFINSNVSRSSKYFDAFQKTMATERSKTDAIRENYLAERRREIKEEIANMDIRTKNEYARKHPELSKEKVAEHFKIYQDAYKQATKEELPTAESIKKEHEEMQNKMDQLHKDMEKGLDLLQKQLNVMTGNKEVIEETAPQEEQPDNNTDNNTDNNRSETETERDPAKMGIFATSLEEMNRAKLTVDIALLFSQAKGSVSEFSEYMNTMNKLTAGKSLSQLEREYSVFTANTKLLSDFAKDHPEATAQDIEKFYNEATKEVAREYTNPEPQHNEHVYAQNTAELSYLSLATEYMNFMSQVDPEMSYEDLKEVTNNVFEGKDLNTLKKEFDDVKREWNSVSKYMDEHPEATNEEVMEYFNKAVAETESAKKDMELTEQELDEVNPNREHIEVPEASDGNDVPYQPTKEELEEQLQLDKEKELENQQQREEEEIKAPSTQEN